MADSTRLDGKVAVVTGASRGIGRAAALALAEAGAAVALTARSTDGIRETARTIAERGGRALDLPADVSRWKHLVRVVKQTEEALGPPDILVANAGVIHPVGNLWGVDPTAWAQHLSINLTGAFFSVRAVLPGMIRRDAGVLVFISSGAAAHTMPGWSAYCAAKAGLDHMARNLTDELAEAESRVRVHVLYPGIVDTPMQGEIREIAPEQFSQAERFRKFYVEGWLRPPEEPAAVIRWLATPLADSQHGQITNIDDPAVREQVARDLGTAPIKGRGE